MVPVWKSWDTLWEMVLSFYHMGPKDRALVVNLGSLKLYQLIPLLNPPGLVHILISIGFLVFLGAR